MARSKYPRTPHLFCSPGGSRDDRRLPDDRVLLGEELVILEKLDGSGVSLHREGVFARSKQASPTHPSFSPLKALHATVAWRLPDHLSLFGEWLHTVHSVRYPALPVTEELQVFAVRDDAQGWWWGWDEVTALADELGLQTAPVLDWDRFTDVAELHRRVTELAGAPSVFGPEREGVVVRVAAGFPDADFATSVAKWVRAGHVAGLRWERFGVIRHQR